jgi:peptidoglycan/xylan/chitin deacetylase (PgdA/CDA1 family)
MRAGQKDVMLKRSLSFAIAVCGFCVFTFAPPAALGADHGLAGMKVAVTVDDLPAHGDLLPGVSRMDMTRGVLKALKDNGLTQVYGFANGLDIGSEPDLIDVLKEWLKAGYPVGNHSYSHADLDKVTAPEYIADIEKMDVLLKTLSPVSPLIQQRHVYRYPYLDEGNTLEKRNAVRSYLFKNGYRIAEVTIDYDDWAWNDTYIRCMTQHDSKSVAWLKVHVQDAAESRVRESKAEAEILFGRDIAHILLVHDGIFDALMLGTILKDLRSQGVKFVTLDQALADPVYKIDPDNAYSGGLAFLEEIAAARKISLDSVVDDPYTVDKLNEFCKQAPVHPHVP